ACDLDFYDCPGPAQDRPGAAVTVRGPSHGAAREKRALLGYDSPRVSTTARVRRPRRSNAQRPANRSDVARRYSGSLSLTLLRYAPPSVMVRRAAPRPCTRPVAANRSTISLSRAAVAVGNSARAWARVSASR